MIQTVQFSVTFALAPAGVDDWHSLEFVLHAAEDRNEKGYGFYAREAHDMLNEALQALQLPGTDGSIAWVIGEQSYGSISFEVGYELPSHLDEVLRVCVNVAEAWAKRFNVAKMKR